MSGIVSPHTYTSSRPARPTRSQALSTMEVRQPRFLVLPIPPMLARNLRIEGAGPGGVAGPGASLVWDLPGPDPVRVEVEKDLKELFRQYGREYPTKPSWSTPARTSPV